MMTHSHSAKPIGYYASNPAIDELTRHYGSNLEEMSEQVGYLVLLSLLDFAGSGMAPQLHPIADAIEFQDVNGEMPTEVAGHLEAIVDQSTKRQLLDLATGILEQLKEGVEDS